MTRSSNPPFWALATYLLLQMVIANNAFTAFDCESDNAQHMPLDITSAAQCPDPQKDFLKATPIRAQLVQTDSEIAVDGYACKATISKVITRSGYDCIMYNHQTLLDQEMVEFTGDECRHAVKTGTVVVNGKPYRAAIGKAVFDEYYSAGRNDNNGDCEYETVVRGDEIFPYSYEITRIRINIEHLRGEADGAQERVTFTNGLIASFKDGSAFDHFLGTVTWETNIADCSSQVSNMWFGNATIHRRVGFAMQDSVVMIRDKITKQYLGLILKTQIILCGKVCWNTQIKGIVTCFPVEGEVPIDNAIFQAHFDQLNVNVQAQIGFAHLSTNFAMRKRFANVVTDLCVLDRRTLNIKLQMISGGNNDHALLDLLEINGKGTRLYRAGSVAYIQRCVPVEVRRYNFPNCTQELPVVRKGRNVTLDNVEFVDLFTYTIVPYPTTFPCSPVMPTFYNINGEWICSNPSFTTCAPPRQLNTSMTTGQALLESFTEGIGELAYSEAQGKLHITFLRESAARSAVTQYTVHRLAGSTDSGLGSFLSKEDIRNLQFDIHDYMFPLISWAGRFGIYFFGIVTLILMIVKALATMWRVYKIIQRDGCGARAGAGILDVFIQLFSVPIKILVEAFDQAKDTSDLNTVDRDIEAQHSARPSAPGLVPTHAELLHTVHVLQASLNGLNARLETIEFPPERRDQDHS